MESFDPPNIIWHPANNLGEPFEVQICPHQLGLARHRTINPLGPWIMGYPPRKKTAAHL